VTQAAIAFAQVLGAFSLAITNFGQLSSLAAVIDRLSTLTDSLDHPPPISTDDLEIVETPDRWACERLTLYAMGGQRTAIEEMTFENSVGKRLLVMGPKGVGKTELFGAVAGLHATGKGRIGRPSDAVFLPLRPYYPPGTLREIMTDFDSSSSSDERIAELLHLVGFGVVGDVRRMLDENADWTKRLSPRDLQAVSVVRLLLRRPRWAFMNGVVTPLAPPQREQVYLLLDEVEITYVTFADDMECARFHDRILHIEGGGRWRLEERGRAVIPSRGTRTS
jgi:putative ATP-binding cassette transporter